MTSQKSSVSKHVAYYDFRHSFKALIIPGIITLLYNLYFFVLSPINTWKECIAAVSDVNKMARIQQLKQYFHCIMTGDFADWTPITNIFIVFLGMLFAFFTFLYLYTKKSTNFYLSVGLTRKIMFRNRVLASVIVMLATVLIPTVIDIIINVVTFGHPNYILEYGLFNAIVTFGLMFSGFAFMSIAMVAGVTIPDSIFFGGALVCAPTMLMAYGSVSASAFLRGYGYDFVEKLVELSHFNPLVMLSGPYNVLQATNRVSVPNDSVSYDQLGYYRYDLFTDGDYQYLTFKYIAPALGWIIGSAVLLGIAYLVYKNRKIENTGIIRRSYGATVGLAIFGGLCTATIAALYFAAKSIMLALTPAVYIVVVAAVAFVTVAIIIWIFSKSIKNIKMWLLPSISLAVATVVVSSIMATGGFGYSVYTPDIDKLACVKVSTDYMNCAGAAVTDEDYSIYSGLVYSGTNNTLGTFTTQEGIKKVYSAIDAVQPREYSMQDSTVEIEYIFKNGKKTIRKYSNITADGAKAVASIAQCDEYKDRLNKLMLSENRPDIATYIDGKRDNVEYDEIGAMYDTLHNGTAGIYGVMAKSISVDNTKVLRKALLLDLEKIGYSKVYSEDKELFSLVFEPEYFTDEYGEKVPTGNIVSYSIYADMTNTIAYLESVGAMQRFKDYDLTKDVKKACIVPLKDIDLMMFISRYYNFSKVDKENSYEEYMDFDTAREITDMAELKELVARGQTTGVYDKNDDYILIVKFESGSVYRMLSSKDAKI
ncbi:MAG: hypothetical protein ACI4IN_03115 [Eubacterium sp.]